MHTYDNGDPVSAEVEFHEGVQASQLCHARDLIASQVEHPEVGQVRQLLHVAYLAVRV